MQAVNVNARRVIPVLFVAALAAAGLTAGHVWAPHAGCGPCEAKGWSSNERFSDEFNHAMARLGESSRRKRLDAVASQELIAVIRAYAPRMPTRYSAEFTTDEAEASQAMGYGYTLIGDRLRRGGLSPADRASLAACVASGLRSANPRERLLASAAAFHGGLASDPDFYGRIAVLATDECPIVREHVVRRLALQQGEDTRRDGYPRD